MTVLDDGMADKMEFQPEPSTWQSFFSPKSKQIKVITIKQKRKIQNMDPMIKLLKRNLEKSKKQNIILLTILLLLGYQIYNNMQNAICHSLKRKQVATGKIQKNQLIVLS